jgi:hypothetical protein
MMKQLTVSRDLPTAHRGVSTRSRRINTRVMAAVADVLQGGASGPKPDIPAGLNKFSSRITQPKSQGASQAMLYGTGLKEQDMDKPQVRMAAVAVFLQSFHFINPGSFGFRGIEQPQTRHSCEI